MSIQRTYGIVVQTAANFTTKKTTNVVAEINSAANNISSIARSDLPTVFGFTLRSIKTTRNAIATIPTAITTYEHHSKRVCVGVQGGQPAKKCNIAFFNLHVVHQGNFRSKLHPAEQSLHFLLCLKLHLRN